MKKLKALYNDDTNKIIKEATQDKAIKILNFLIDLAMVTTDTILVPEETTTLLKLGIISMQTLVQNGKKPFAKSSPT